MDFVNIEQSSEGKAQGAALRREKGQQKRDWYAREYAGRPLFVEVGGNRLVNLTHNPITIFKDRSEMVTIPVSGMVASYRIQYDLVHDLGKVQVMRATGDSPRNVPAPEEGTYFIVPSVIRLALPDRRDLVSPADLVKDSTGNVLGSRVLVANNNPNPQNL